MDWLKDVAFFLLAFACIVLCLVVAYAIRVEISNTIRGRR